MLLHRNDHSMNGHYADQQPLPWRTRPHQARPSQAAPSHSALPHRSTTSKKWLNADQPLPCRARPCHATPCTASWYSVPAYLLQEEIGRYVVALALPCHCAPNPAAPSPSTPRCVFTPHNTPEDALYAEKSALAMARQTSPGRTAPRLTPPSRIVFSHRNTDCYQSALRCCQPLPHIAMPRLAAPRIAKPCHAEW